MLITDVSDDTEDDSEEDTTYADIANVMSDMSVQHRRGLPPPPCGAFISPDSPPPNPREMYSQSGIYDVIPGEKVKCDEKMADSLCFNPRDPCVLICVIRVC